MENIMDNELDVLDRGFRRNILIIDDGVHIISLLGRNCFPYLPPTALLDNTRPSGRRPAQRRRNQPWK